MEVPDEDDGGNNQDYHKIDIQSTRNSVIGDKKAPMREI